MLSKLKPKLQGTSGLAPFERYEVVVMEDSVDGFGCSVVTTAGPLGLRKEIFWRALQMAQFEKVEGRMANCSSRVVLICGAVEKRRVEVQGTALRGRLPSPNYKEAVNPCASSPKLLQP